MAEPINQSLPKQLPEGRKLASSSPPLQLSTVYDCASTAEADHLLGNPGQGYVYQRDGHPNGDQLAESIASFHRATQGAITSSGMSALAAALLAKLQTGDHVVVSEQVYGKSLTLFDAEAKRLGIASTIVDSCDLAAVSEAMRPATKLVVVETITNPRLRVSNLRALSDVAHQGGAWLLVDNTFASPSVCRPLDWGADLVMESLTKIVNGHGDLIMGAICGNGEAWERIADVVTTWGLRAAPFECWLAQRSLRTLALRVEQASRTAMAIAEFLSDCQQVESVDYPGLPDHPDHELASGQFEAGCLGGSSEASRQTKKLYGNMVTFHLNGGASAVDRLIAGMSSIPFFPSLGDTSTSLSHPCSTSHRKLAPQQLEALGISPGTVRLSVGLEPVAEVLQQLEKGLLGLDG